MRNVKLLLLLFIIISSSIAQTRIAVVDFESKGVSETEVSALTDRLRDELFKTGKYKVLERAMMEEILKEQGFQLSGCTSDECVIEIGKLVGVEQIIGGSISKIGSVYSVSSRIISVETGEILQVANYDFAGNISGLLTQGMRNAAIQLSSGEIINRKIVKNQLDNTGILYITSEPSGASVWIDNIKIDGVTPLIVENHTAGIHTIYLRKDDYEGRTDIELRVDDLKKVNVPLQLGNGILKIITDPFEADVYLDDIIKGKSPLIVKDVKAGRHKLRIQKKGYSILSKEVFVNTDQTSEIRIALEKKATIIVETTPVISNVILDGKKIGETPIVQKIDAGRHKLIIQATDYYTNESDIDLKPGEEKVFQPNLSDTD